LLFIAHVSLLIDIELPIFNRRQIIQAKGANQPGGEKARGQNGKGAKKPVTDIPDNLLSTCRHFSCRAF